MPADLVPIDIMICGDRGIGKTTLAARLRDVRVRTAHAAGPTPDAIRPQHRIVQITEAPNMADDLQGVVSASFRAEFTVIVADARTGLTAQTKQWAAITALLRAPRVVLAVNKMDLVDFDQSRFEEIAAAFRAIAGHLALENVVAIPLVATDGDMITQRGDRLSWYEGPSLLSHLATAPPATAPLASPPAAVTADQFAARLMWSAPDAMHPGRQYRLECASQSVSAAITQLKGRLNVETGELVAGRHLASGEIGACTLATLQQITVTPYAMDRQLGSFVLFDKLTESAVGAGTFTHELRRSSNVRWQALDIDKAARAEMKGQTPRCLWFTGLSGAGKSTIANAVERQLAARKQHTFLLDGDNVRHGLCRDLGFTSTDRVENIRRVGEVAKLMVEAGLIVIVAFISPFRAERRMARELFAPGEFLEVFIDAPLAVCEARDPKGLYRKARAGELQNFTGIDSAYEPPDAPEIHLRSDLAPPDDLAASVLSMLGFSDDRRPPR